jgi:hypothetical protein
MNGTDNRALLPRKVLPVHFWNDNSFIFRRLWFDDNIKWLPIKILLMSGTMEIRNLIPELVGLKSVVFNY